jgi:hypothetical protein
MSEEESKKLMQRRVELAKQLESLRAQRRDGLYTPGMTIVPHEQQNEQIDLQIEEIEATIAEIDEELERHPEA